MRVLKIWDSEYPWDVRAEKVCSSLTEAGHEVHMVARNRDRRITEEVLEECTVHRLEPWARLGTTLDAATQFPAFLNPRWLRLMIRTAKRYACEVVLVRDLPLAPAAIWVARRVGIPVILDMAENYPAMIRDLWSTGATSPGDLLIRNPWAVTAVERWCLPRLDHILVMVDESLQRLEALGVPDTKLTVVSNTPRLSRIEEYRRHRLGRRQTGTGALRLVYLGLMEEARGVGLAIEAVARARGDGTPVTLDLIGAGRALNDLRDRATGLGLGDDIVRFHGFIPYAQALAKIACFDAGLIPHYANESWETTIPNKLFDYMSLGLPVLASSVTPVARLLGETGAGLIFNDRDVDDLTKAIQHLFRSGQGEAMGRAGVAAVRARYHWEEDAARFLSVLEQVVNTSVAQRGK